MSTATPQRRESPGLAALLATVYSFIADGRREMARLVAGMQALGPRAFAKREFGRMMAADRSENPFIRAGQMGGDVVNTILVIVIAAVVGYVGIKAASETNDSIDVAGGSEFDNASSSITSGFASAMDLTEVVFIVLMLSVIIAVLVGLRGGRR